MSVWEGIGGLVLLLAIVAEKVGGGEGEEYVIGTNRDSGLSFTTREDRVESGEQLEEIKRDCVIPPLAH